MIRAFRRIRAVVAMMLTMALLLNSAIMVDASEVHDVVTGMHQAVQATAARLKQSEPLTVAQASPTASSLPSLATSLQPLNAPARVTSSLESVASAETLLTMVPLGSTLAQVHAILGDPWFVVGESGHSYWTYGVDNDTAWLMIGVSKAAVESVQVTARADVTSALADASHVALSTPASSASLPTGAMVLHTANGQPQSVVPTGGTTTQAMRFYGTDAKGMIERIGLSVGDATMPLIVRWFRRDGFAASRAIDFSRYAKIGEAAYLRQNPDPHFPCEGGGVWNITKHQRLMYGGVPLDAATASCGLTRISHTSYFNLSSVAPHGFDVDPLAQTAMLGTARPNAMRDAVAAGEMSPNTIRPQTGSTTGQIWSLTPFGQRCIIGNMACDLMLQYINDPANPLSTITLSASQAQIGTGAAPHAIKANAATPAGGGIHTDLSISCGFGNGFAKCGGLFIAFAAGVALVGIGIFGSIPVALLSGIALIRGDGLWVSTNVKQRAL